MPEKKQPFIAADERPEVRLAPDRDLTSLTIRDLRDIIGELLPKHRIKELKIEKIEKIEKPEKWEKFEKIEKPEKFEKWERYEIEKRDPDVVKDKEFEPGEDPFRDPRIFEIGQLVESISKLSAQVEDMAGRLTRLERG